MSERILLVEDDPSLREWITFELTRAGYAVDVAVNGLMALRMLAADHFSGVSLDNGEPNRTTPAKNMRRDINAPMPELILLDVQMPTMNGLELCRMLQTVPETATIPIVFLTAATDADDIAAGLKAGAVDYINKPFRISELKSRIQTLLRPAKTG